ncbi:helix-turn-helix domain containing protein [Parvibaculaceae bacterium PLY_AMNH_Bact1]|nr:helix-turn-helix domain containing protein [Parvibaculaceae bacterium PLY_AMNH_Bact1]
MSQLETIPRPRLSRAERRQQLLDVARTLIAEQGADAVTLALVAEQAGVSKPMAYDHFETRTGLLLALLEDADRHYEGVARARIASAPETVEAIAAIIAEAYIACALEAGPAAAALTAAIEANGDARDVGRASRDLHAKQFAEAFAPVLSEGDARANLIFIGLVAAANTLCAELTAGRITEQAATETLTHLLTTSITPLVP